MGMWVIIICIGYQKEYVRGVKWEGRGAVYHPEASELVLVSWPKESLLGTPRKVWRGDVF